MRASLAQVATLALAALTISVPAAAHVSLFGASMSGAAEAPPNGSLGTGTVLITVDDHDFTMRVQTTFSGLTGNLTIAHIHCCTAVPMVSTAGVATPLPSFPGFPAGNTFGSYDNTFVMTEASSWNPAFITAHGGTTGSAFSALLAGFNNGTAYLNLHTTFIGGGEIRGFLQPVPEPSTYALMFSGLAAVGLMARRRRG